MSVTDAEIEVDLPLRVAYDQWTRFEEFPSFMQGVDEVRRLDETNLHWVATVAGVRREWNARITEQVPDRAVGWTSASGTPHDGLVTFEAAGAHRTRVMLRLDLEPDGVQEAMVDVPDPIRSRASGDLCRFKEYIESRRTAAEPWRKGDSECVAGDVGDGAAALTRTSSPEGIERLLGALPVVLVFVEPTVALSSRTATELLGEHLVELVDPRIRVLAVARVEPVDAVAATAGNVQVLADPGGALAGCLGVTYRLGRQVTVLLGSDGLPEATWVDRAGRELVDEITQRLDQHMEHQATLADDAPARGAMRSHTTAASTPW